MIYSQTTSGSWGTVLDNAGTILQPPYTVDVDFTFVAAGYKGFGVVMDSDGGGTGVACDLALHTTTGSDMIAFTNDQTASYDGGTVDIGPVTDGARYRLSVLYDLDPMAMSICRVIADDGAQTYALPHTFTQPVVRGKLGLESLQTFVPAHSIIIYGH